MPGARDIPHQQERARRRRNPPRAAAHSGAAHGPNGSHGQPGSPGPRSRRADRGRGGERSRDDRPGSLDRLAQDLSTWVPQGRGLPPEDWDARHRLLTWVLALHVPALIFFGRSVDYSYAHGVLLALPVVVLLGIACLPVRARRLRAGAASLGLLTCSAVLVHLAHGLPEMHYHFFVVVGLIALYEDWTFYLLAMVFVLVQGGVLSRVSPGSVYDHPGSPWLLATVHAGFVLALAGAQVVFWHYNEQSRRRTEHYRRQLYVGQQSLMARLEETDRIRADLVATVSHEFRTPLTGIRASLLTIRRRRERLSDAQVDDMLDAAVAYNDRLSRLLENMLTAATATSADDSTVADLSEVIADVVAELRYSPAMASQMQVDLPTNLPVRMSRQGLYQVVANLVDNALTHSWPGALVALSAGRVGDEVVLRVRNPGPDLDPATIRSLFEPFTQRESTSTRNQEGAGMGLYVVRRLVEVDGGRLRMTSEEGEIVVEVDLPAAVEPPLPPLPPLPTMRELTTSPFETGPNLILPG